MPQQKIARLAFWAAVTFFMASPVMAQTAAPNSYTQYVANRGPASLQLPAGYNGGVQQDLSAPAPLPPRSGHSVYYYAPGAAYPVLMQVSDNPAEPQPSAASGAPVPLVQAQQYAPAPAPAPAPDNANHPVGTLGQLQYPAAPSPMPMPMQMQMPMAAPQLAPPRPVTYGAQPMAAQNIQPAVPPGYGAQQPPQLPTSTQPLNYSDPAQPPAAPSVAPLLAEAEPPQGVPTDAAQTREGLPYMGLETRRGFDVGFEAMRYRYRESDLDVTEVGPMLGVTAAGTWTFGHGLFAIADGRYDFGWLDYRGSGTEDNKWNDLWEVRGLVGMDYMQMDPFSFSPYTGLGFRQLYDDNRGTTTIDAFGYRRMNQIFYLPIGVMPRMHLDEKSRLTSMLEYDVLLHGSQTSYLSDGGQGDPNIENQQHSGFGIRANIMYETQWWSVGPFLNYWSIDQSKVKFFVDPSSSTCTALGGSAPCVLQGDEPKNHTFEMGVAVKFHFY